MSYFDDFYKYLYLAKVADIDHVYKVGVTSRYTNRIQNLRKHPIQFEEILVFVGRNVYSKEQEFLQSFSIYPIGNVAGASEFILIPEIAFNDLSDTFLSSYVLLHVDEPD